MAIAIMVLTAILVIVTGFYALQTKLMVDEMRRARGASITPKVALSFEHLGGPVSFPLLINCGVGPALEVDVKISYEPGETHFVWSSPLMVAGESIRFNGPDETLDMRKLIERYDRIVLTGQCQDAMGDSHEIRQVIDPKTYWEAQVGAKRSLETDYVKKTTDELERIRKELERQNRL